MEAKHTPGPWEAVGNLVRSPMDESLGCGVMLAECSDRWFQKVNSDEAKANARLIAACPELLEALNRVVDFYDEDLPSDVIDQARAAIAKATGQS